MTNLMGVNPRVMGQFTLSRRLKIFGWLATAVMVLCTLTMLASLRTHNEQINQ